MIFCVFIRRGEMEKSLATRNLPVAKAVFSFLKDNVSPSFNFSGWNKGRIVCQRSQLKRLSSLAPSLSSEVPIEGLISITNSSFPLPGSQLYTTADVDTDQQSGSKIAAFKSENEIMETVMR